MDESKLTECDECGCMVYEYKKILIQVPNLDLGVPVFTHMVQCKECEKLEKDGG